jgi:hypothetical protein
VNERCFLRISYCATAGNADNREDIMNGREANEAPLVGGGQGRTGREVEAAAAVACTCGLGALLVVLVVILLDLIGILTR